MSRPFTTGLLVAALGLTTFVPTLRAQALPEVRRLHRDHTITFDEPIALVNGVTLPAGTYLFTFPLPGQGITRVTSPDRSKVYATLPTISKQRTNSHGFDVVLVSEGSGKTPRTLKAWFCDGTRTGHEFVAEIPKR